MRAVEITRSTFADYARRRRKEMWVLTRKGKPVAAVVPIRSGADLESFGLSHNRQFIEILNRSWESYKKKGGVSLQEMRSRHRLGHRQALQAGGRRRAARPVRRSLRAKRR